MKIRPFSEKDRDQVIALWHECGLVVPENGPSKDIDRKLQVNPELFLVGIESDKVVCTVMGGYEGHRGWINYLAVKPSEQRKGLGRQMMATIEERLRQKGCPKINLQIRQSNRAVIAFYAALGYLDDAVIGLGKRFDNDAEN